MEKAREFQKNIYFCFIDYARAFDCVDHNKPWIILKEMGIPDHLQGVLVLFAKEPPLRRGLPSNPGPQLSLPQPCKDQLGSGLRAEI